MKKINVKRWGILISHIWNKDGFIIFLQSSLKEKGVNQITMAEIGNILVIEKNKLQIESRKILKYQEHLDCTPQEDTEKMILIFIPKTVTEEELVKLTAKKESEKIYTNEIKFLPSTTKTKTLGLYMRLKRFRKQLS